MNAQFSGRRVLVTGGSGFIGGQLVVRLARDCGASVRVLLRKFGSAARIARFPVELVRGDIASAEDVDRAVAGCDLVFHCAYGRDGDTGSRMHTTVAGAENVFASALRHKVSRVVYLSTTSVYGELTTSELDETAPRRTTGDVYGDAKLAAEEVAFRYVRRGLPIAIIQPSVVYGPFGSSFTVKPLQQLATGRVPLINGGSGRCNAAYVDDVVAALMLAAVKREAVGEAFLVAGPQPTTWGEFFGSYERMLGVSATVSMTPEEALTHYAASQRTSGTLVGEAMRIVCDPHTRERLISTRDGAWLASGIRHMLPTRFRDALKERMRGPVPTRLDKSDAVASPKIHPLRPARVNMFAAPTVFRIDKAVHCLGYVPRYDLQTGMRLTHEWARWANLLPP